MHALPDLSLPLCREIFADLCGMLPPLIGDIPDTGPSDARAARNEFAMAAVAALHPGDAFEARLAVRIVAMDAHAADCLRSAGLAPSDAAEVRRCRAQAASMARQSDAALRGLQRMQAVRDKQLADMHPGAMERAGYWFHDASVPAPAPAPADSPAPETPPAPSPAAPPAAADQDFVEADMAEQAATYAVIYPDRFARIRAAGGLPARLDFGPPEPALVQAILNGAGPALPISAPPA
ncbi:MAG: hypothetical protein WDN25_29575 [Acetobacteraceae bacterium]